MNEIFAKRLKSARLLSAMSLAGLADAVDGVVSKNAIAKYERAEMMPGSAVLIALAKALNVKTAYFFKPFNIEIDQVEFRKKSKLGAKKVAVIKQQVTDQIQRYLEIESLLNIDTPFINPIGEVSVEDPSDVEKAVELLLSEWQLGLNALPNILELLEDKNVKVIELDADLAFDGLSGWAVYDGKRIPFMVVNLNYPIERKRFTALHELGHLLLSFKDGLEKKMIEKLCNVFAGAMLIPSKTFMSELGKHRRFISLPELISIKENYGVSIQSIMARAHSLNIINQSRYVKFRKYISNNRKEENLGSYKGKEHSDRFMQLIYRATAEEVISMIKAANLSNQKLAEFRDEFMPL